MSLHDWQWRFPIKPSLAWNISSGFVLASVGLLSRFFMRKHNCRHVLKYTGHMCDLRVENTEQLYSIMTKREKERGVITVSNHPSCLDDPLLWGVLPARVWANPFRARWCVPLRQLWFNEASKESGGA